MRARVVGLTVIGLGGLAVAASATAPSWVPLTPVDLRLDESSGTASAGEGVGYVDPVDLTQVHQRRRRRCRSDPRGRGHR